jgi:hypothetical protein
VVWLSFWQIETGRSSIKSTVYHRPLTMFSKLLFASVVVAFAQEMPGALVAFRHALHRHSSDTSLADDGGHFPFGSVVLN